MKLIPVPTKLIKAGDDVAEVLLESTGRMGLKVEDGDVVAVADKVIAISKGRFLSLDEVKPSWKAYSLSEGCRLEPALIEVVLKEADVVLSYVKEALLTLKAGVLIANAGVDRKNAPDNKVTLWLKDPSEAARELWHKLKARTGVERLGVILVDSRVNPLRMGTTGFALGFAGFKPVRDYRGQADLYGRTIHITRVNVADDLASAAHLLIGEGADRVPAVIIRGAPIEFDEKPEPKELLISPEECLYGSLLKNVN